MSPLGELYGREAARLRRRYPTLEAEQIDRLVTRSLARAFLDLDAAELAQAMVEGGLHSNEPATYITRLVALAVQTVAKERDQ